MISRAWSNFTLAISDTTPVESSAMLVSSPLLYSDKWNVGKPGWIHTSYDNSTSTQTLNWLEPNNLEEQIKVAALSVMRVSQSSQIVDLHPIPPPSFWALGIAVAIVVVVVTVAYFVGRRKPPAKNIMQ
jgi:hypothetical protein